MTDMFKAMIVLQERALEAQRRQMAFAEKWMSAGHDALAAQKQGVAAMDAGAKAWKSWLDLWGVKG